MRISDPVTLAGEFGELMAVRLAVDPRLVEDALDALAHAPFPINPELRHAGGENIIHTVIEFPAYSQQLPALSSTLNEHGLDTSALTALPMMKQLRSE